MAVRIEPHAEPIAGYKLIERLGGGGFGEVWKAEAPGGLFKAIKFVYGDLEALDSPDGSRAEQELKAMSRVKSVHHPYILSLERFDIIEGQLIIVMELADRTLWDRFRECRGQGLVGIPRDELINYMQETAEALDMMNSMFQLQHLDIKPQNLFLVYNHVKVADFGLVKDLGGRNEATITGGSTPVYAAPETFDGWLSRYTDQYSLAIVYQELLTGQRPFSGSSIRQLVMQHLQGVPDLNALPVADRTIIARGLSKKPEDRYPTCRDMIAALRGANLPQSRPSPAAGSLENTVPDGGGYIGETPSERPAGRGPDSMRTHDVRVQPHQAPDQADTEGARPGADRPQVLPTRARAEMSPGENSPVRPVGPVGMTQTAPYQKPKSAPVIESLGGVLQPALVIGLGQLGLETLRQVRRFLSEEIGPPDSLPQLRLLGLDVDADTIAAACQGDVKTALRNSEVVLTKLNRASHYLKPREGKLPHERWLNAKLLYRLGKQNGAGARALGRLAVVEHARALSRRMEMDLEACCANDSPHEGGAKTELGLRTAVPRVFILAGLAGQTGSGMILDVAYLVKSLLRRLGKDGAEVVGLFFLPHAGRNANPGDLATTYATLRELQQFTTANAVFHADLDLSESSGPGQKFCERGSAFQRCLFLPLPEKRTSREGVPPEAVVLAGQFLYRKLATPLGELLEEGRRALPMPSGGGIRLGSFGLFRFVWPRKTLLEKVSKRVCRRLVDRWMAKTIKGLDDELGTWAEQQWESEGMRPENLIARHQELCEKHLQQNPERLIAGTINPLVSLLSKAGKSPIQLSPVLQAVANLSKLLGFPDECRPQTGAQAFQEPGAIEKALTGAFQSIISDCDHKLSVWIVKLIEDPRYRLAGAEEALRQFTGLVERALESQEQLTRELRDRATLVFQRIQAILDQSYKPTSLSSSGLKANQITTPKSQPTAQANIPTDLLELIKSYPKLRYQSLILGHINALYESLRGQLSDQMREIGFCRTRLGELHGLFEEARPTHIVKRASQISAEHEENLLPEGCPDLEAAARQLDEKVSAKDLVDLDQKIQRVVKKNCQALVQVCMGPANVVRALAPLMVQEAGIFLEPRLAGASVGEMFLRHKAKAGNELVAVSQALAAAYDEAGSGFVKDPVAEVAVASAPGDDHGQRVLNYLRGELSQVKTITTQRLDEIVLMREEYFSRWSDLEHLGEAAEEAYDARRAADPSGLHTREDIAAWATPPKAFA